MGSQRPLSPYFSIGLGAEPATPLEMARAYASLADGGYRLDSSLFGDEPLIVKSVTLPNGKTLREPHRPASGARTRGRGAAIEDQLLQGVVSYGTGTAAKIPGWQIAGKTGTTENYGDAWFVGFTPDLVTAVWVGYPNNLVPMLTEFHGQPVEGGTYPALIWKDYMEKALAYLHETPTAVPGRVDPGRRAPTTVTFGDDYGNRPRARQRQLPRLARRSTSSSGMAPTKLANCLPNAVEVPDVRGMTLAPPRAASRPTAGVAVRYTPANAGRAARTSSSAQIAARRGAVGLRQGDARAAPAAARGRARPRRPHARPRAGESRPPRHARRLRGAGGGPWSPRARPPASPRGPE